MKKLLITLLLISPFSFADWGDVYYCESTSGSHTTLDGLLRNYTYSVKFQFKLDETKQAMVFGSSSSDYFRGEVFELKPLMHIPSKEYWYAGSRFSTSFFKEGKFLYARVGVSGGISTISADCEKF